MSNEIFIKGLQSKYDALQSKNPTTFYFTTDTRSLYVGDTLYTEAIRFYTGSFPTTPATGVLYFNTDTGVASAWKGTEWVTIVRPVVTVIDDSATDETSVSPKAVKTFVENAINDAVDDITGGSEVITNIVSKVGSNGTIEIVKGDDSRVEVPLTGVAHDPTYDSVNLKLTIPVVGSTDIVVNIPKDNFVESGSYDSNTDELVLAMKQGGEVRIPAADLIDVYTSGSGVNDTVIISVGADNKLSATFKVDTTSVLGIAADGKLTIDLSSYATVSSVEALESAIDTLNGDVTTVGSVAKMGADTLQAAKSYADNLNNDMDNRVDSIESSINILNGDDQTNGSIAKTVADAVGNMTSVTDEINDRVVSVEAALTWGVLA